MNRALVISLLSAVLGSGLVALPGGPALAQGFGSVSSASPAEPPLAATSAEVAAPDTLAGAVAEPVAALPEPIAQMASLDFASVSGAVPDVTTAMPTTAEAYKSAG